MRAQPAYIDDKSTNTDKTKQTAKKNARSQAFSLGYSMSTPYNTYQSGCMNKANVERSTPNAASPMGA